ncbi:MAG: hypothetical protein NZ899_14580 [Thermoguttaceae bacterium]|nr:hypothetical protein [Thermoguttaceae bacterium]MDW8080187.1 hypothetical protein [Thermoguttaceae bacterium]
MTEKTVRQAGWRFTGLSRWFFTHLSKLVIAASAWTAATWGVAAENSTYWVMSTREISLSAVKPGVYQTVTVLRADEEGALDEAKLEGLVDAILATKRVVIYLPGNRSDFASGHCEGWALYKLLSEVQGAPPIVFALWSWPADRVTFGQRSDIWIKACRADAEAFILADWLRTLRSDVRVLLVTYSLSARAALGALHLLGGGQVAERQLENTISQPSPQIAALLVAPAVDAHALAPGGAFELAIARAHKVALTVHPGDTLLRLYPLLYGLRGPQALGFVGPICLRPEDAEKVDIIPMQGWAGRGHGWQNYFSTVPVRSQLEAMATH